jgi:ATP synthase assembly factor FMC1
MSNSQTQKALSLYRSLLRELPPRPLSSISPLQKRIRSSIATPPASEADAAESLQEAEQFVTYVRAQRMYSTLLERYNPGMSMEEEERVRLTARRVGMDLPEEWRKK